jgi:hypothetical protein
MSGGFGFPIGCVAAVAAVIIAAAFRTSFSAAAGVAVVAWALHSGFVLGRAGALTFRYVRSLPNHASSAFNHANPAPDHSNRPSRYASRPSGYASSPFRYTGLA